MEKQNRCVCGCFSKYVGRDKHTKEKLYQCFNQKCILGNDKHEEVRTMEKKQKTSLLARKDKQLLGTIIMLVSLIVWNFYSGAIIFLPIGTFVMVS